MSDYEKYVTYSVEDFITDDDYFNWIRHPDAHSDSFWQTFVLLYPGKEAVMREARAFILQATRDEQFSIGERKLLWTDIHRQINKQGHVIRLRPMSRIMSIRWGRVAACVAALLLFGSIGYLYYTHGTATIVAVYGQKKIVTLPDGSVVTLNGHSSIRYARNFNTGKSRELWVEGEAYFDVKHSLKAGPFLVHTPDVNIEVLGTQFNVNTRRGDALVSLNSGKIRVSFKDRQEIITMNPGELVNYKKTTHQYARTNINPYKYSSWVDDKLILDNTPLSTITRLLDDNYGLKTVVADTSLLSEQLSGEIPTGQEAEMISALSKVLNIHITKQADDTLVITRNP